MPNGDKPNSFLQEGILTLICHSDEEGRVLRNLVTPDLFESDYRILAEKAINYWNAQNQAPKVHSADLISDILTDQGNRRASTFRQILYAMQDLAPSINAKYVMGSINAFIRTQKFKKATLKAADLITRNQELAIPQVEELWYEMLRSREVSFEPGLRLSQFEKVISYFETHLAEFQTSVKELNQNFIVPARGEVILFIAPPNAGKSWWLIDLGKLALRLRKKVCHLSLEMSEEDVALRYYQSLFGVPKHNNLTSKITTFEYGDFPGSRMMSQQLNPRLVGFKEEEIEPDFAFKGMNIREELQARANYMGTIFDNIVIKRFPMRSLTMNGLEAYLDNLEAVFNFVPDLTILDYIGVTKTETSRHRLDLGRNMEDFIGTVTRRNQAGATAHQVNRTGGTSRNVRTHHIAEDWSMVGSAHNIVTYSQTEAEKRFKLARVHVNKARTEQSGFTTLISQNYELGQFCLDSVLMQDNTDQLVKDFTKDHENEESTNSEDD